MNTVSVIIPNYNGKDLFQKYLPLLLQALQNKVVEKYEIIVVDDASTDDSIAFLRSNYPTIRILQNNQNSGFSKSVNKGIFAAQYEALCILNTDMQLTENYFEVLLPMLKEDVFGAFCAIRDLKTKKITEGRKQMIVKRHKLKFRNLNGENEEGQTAYICGGNALLSREKTVALGGYDEIFSPFYSEDVDLTLRAYKKQWKALYSTKTSCFHQHSTTINKYFEKRYVRSIKKRNEIFINYRYLEGTRNRKIYFLRVRLFSFLEKLLGSKYRPYSDGLAKIQNNEL